MAQGGKNRLFDEEEVEKINIRINATDPSNNTKNKKQLKKVLLAVILNNHVVSLKLDRGSRVAITTGDEKSIVEKLLDIVYNNVIASDSANLNSEIELTLKNDAKLYAMLSIIKDKKEW